MIVLVSLAYMNYATGHIEDDRAREYLSGYNRRAEDVARVYLLATWAYNTNITTHNQAVMVRTLNPFRTTLNFAHNI